MANKMKLCILLSSVYSEGMFIPPEVEVCTYLSQLGFEIHWVVRTTDKSETILRDKLFIHLIHCPFSLKRNNLFGKIIREIVYAIYRFFVVYQICKKEKYDFLIVRENVFDSITATILRKKTKSKCILQLYNPLRQEWEGYKVEKKKPLVIYYLIAKFNLIMFKMLFKYTDLVLTTSKWAADDFVSNGVSKEKVLSIPQGINRQRFEASTTSSLKLCQTQNKKIIIYVGSVAKGRKLEILIDAFKKVLSIRDDVILLIVGAGTSLNDLNNLVQTSDILENVIFTGQVKQDEVPYYIQISDIAISPIPPFDFYKMSSPIKLFEYMAMGKPVVANIEIPEHKEVIEQSGGGLLVKYESGAFASGILTLLNNEQTAKNMGNKGRNWVFSNRTYDILAKGLKERLQKLMQ